MGVDIDGDHVNEVDEDRMENGEDEYIDREPITEDVKGEPIAEDIDDGPLGDDLNIDGRAVNDGINKCLLKPFSS